MNNTPFPWHYYLREIRSRIFFIVFTALSVFLVHKIYPANPFPKVLILITALIVVSFVIALLKIIPIRKVLGRIDNIQIKLPHDKKLDHIYQKNEWSLIQEILSLTESYLTNQSNKIKKQGMESDALMESIPNGLVIIDCYQNCKKYNSHFKDLFITNRSEVESSITANVKLWKIFEQQQLLKSFSNVIQSKTPTKLRGFHIPKRNEYFDISVTPLFDSNLNITGALGIFHNVTISKLTEKMRVDFVANVSHEIRTPLTSIIGYSQLLEASQISLSEDQKSITTKILSNSERLKDLFDNLLRLSVIESNNEIDKHYFSSDKLIKQIISSLKGKYLSKKIEINLINESAQLYGDYKLLDQVFTNLFDNAIKYGHEDIKITIECIDEQNTTTIIIQDNGPGIHEDDLKRIFERFYRVQGQSSELIEGTGLGLSIVKHIISKHNGSISVKSEINRGSTFTIELPRI